MKWRITTITANATNALTYVRINLITTAVAQGTNLYPLDLATINLSGFTSGTRIQLYDTLDDVELYNGVPSGTSLSYSTPYVSDRTIRIRAMYMSGVNAKKWVEFTETLTAT